jgi:membrane protein required for colicin V production
MTSVDYALAAIVAVSMLFGIIRGFLRESIALLAWLGGVWVAWREAPQLQPYLGGALQDTDLQVWVARALILAAVVATGWLIGSLLSYIVHRSGFSHGVDRLFGAVFGLARGVVVVGFIVMLGQAAKLQGEPWWRDARLMPLGEEMAGILRNYAETGLREIELPVADT